MDGSDMRKAIVLLMGMLLVASMFLQMSSAGQNITLTQKGSANRALTYNRGSYGIIEVSYWLNVTQSMRVKLSTNGGGINYTARWFIDNTDVGVTSDTTSIGDQYADAPSLTAGSHNILIKWNISNTPSGNYHIRAFARHIEQNPEGTVGTVETDMETTNLAVTVLNQAPGKPFNPSPPSGATGVDINADISWQCTDPNGDPLRYDVYFGTDPNNLPKVTANRIATSTYDPGELVENTTYYWKVNASDGTLTNESDIWFFKTRLPELPPNNPPNKPLISGAKEGLVGKSYSFLISSSDPDKDRIKYEVDWDGDGTIDERTDLYPSGYVLIMSHAWNEAKKYTIKVRAVDEKGSASEWARHNITISEKLYVLEDSDGDGLPDIIEDEIGTDKNDPRDAIVIEKTNGVLVPEKELYYDISKNVTRKVLKTDVDRDGTMDYVFDADGDGKYDYWYDGETGEVKQYIAKPFDWWYLIVIACFAVAIIIGLYGVKRVRR